NTIHNLKFKCQTITHSCLPFGLPIKKVRAQNNEAQMSYGHS
ncbi:16166_t:CDS:1, partial [Entrophospora sp. SA101]